MADSIVIHTNEVALKKGNRGRFEQRLLDTIRSRVKDLGDFTFERRQSGLFVHAKDVLTSDQRSTATDALKKVFGIAHFTFAVRCKAEMDAIKTAAVVMVPEGSRFRVTTKRSDKRFPETSQETSRQVGGYILATVPNTSVDLHTPEHTVFVEIGDAGAFVTSEKIPGPGGLPTGTAGRAVSLLSGGIDSPVATWKIMRRGVEAVMVHFHSYPHVGKESIDKVRTLATSLAEWQGGGTVIMVPFAGIQREIVAKCDPRMRILLYRRAMLRIAERVASRYDALALVTGDSVGQVSSQTLENIRTVSAAVALPIFRPLIGDDKLDIMDAARRIGTYETSIEPHEDCCSLFMPPNPMTRSKPDDAERQEKLFDLERLMEDALKEAETLTLHT